MAKAKLRVVVDLTDIIITRPGTAYVAVYFKPNPHPYLVARRAPVGPQEFPRLLGRLPTPRLASWGGLLSRGFFAAPLIVTEHQRTE